MRFYYLFKKLYPCVLNYEALSSVKYVRLPTRQDLRPGSECCIKTLQVFKHVHLALIIDYKGRELFEVPVSILRKSL